MGRWGPMALVNGIALMMLCTLVPGAAASPLVIEEFQGGLKHATLDFDESRINGSLAIEIPRGATVLDAELTVEGIPILTGDTVVFDFNTSVPGVNLWAKHTGTFTSYPPDFDPTTVKWPNAGKNDHESLKRIDTDYWLTHTPNVTQFPPPVDYPVQLYHFTPGVPTASYYTVGWTGYSFCSQNKTVLYHAEMWLYDSAEDEWDEVDDYSGQKFGDYRMEHRFKSGSDYMSSGGDIYVAIVGQHVDGVNGRPPVYDIGLLRTNHIGVNCTTGTTLLPPYNLSIDVGEQQPVSLDGPLTGPETVGGDGPLAAAIQAVIDSQGVRPGNLTIPLLFGVLSTTGAQVNVSDLRVEYTPVINMAPEWEGPDEVRVDEDAPWTEVIQLDTAFDDDFNSGDLLYEVVSVSDPANLSVRLKHTASPEPCVEVMPAPDFFGSVEMVLGATDLFDALGTSGAITVHVDQVGDKPSLLNPGQQTIDEGDTLDITLEVDDPDKPDDSFTFTDTSDKLDIEATSGRLLWTPRDADVGTHQFGVTVEDRFGFTSSTLIKIIVVNTNNPPTIISELQIEAVQDVTSTYQVLVQDLDLPAWDTIEYYATSDTLNVECDIAEGLVTFTPGNEHVPSAFLTIRIVDMDGAEDQAVVEVLVENVNDAPFLQPLTPSSVEEGYESTHQLVFDDPDRHIAIDPPEALSITFDGPEAFAPDPDGWISFEADQSLVGAHDVTYTVTDRDGLSSSIQVTWVVVNVNDAPTILSDLSEVTAIEDEEFTLCLEAFDVDGDGLVWSDDSSLFAIDGATGTISFTPVQVDVGTYQVTITVNDGNGGIDSESFDLVVENVNDDPVILFVTPEDRSKYDEGQTVAFGAAASDEDGDDLTYTWLLGTKELGTGDRLSVDDLPTGTQEITLVVSDGTSDVEHRFNVVVRESEGLGASLGLLLVILLLVIVVGMLVTTLYLKSRNTPAESQGKEDPEEDGS